MLIGGVLFVTLHGVSDVGIYGLLAGKVAAYSAQHEHGLSYTLYLLTFAVSEGGDGACELAHRHDTDRRPIAGARSTSCHFRCHPRPFLGIREVVPTPRTHVCRAYRMGGAGFEPATSCL